MLGVRPPHSFLSICCCVFSHTLPILSVSLSLSLFCTGGVILQFVAAFCGLLLLGLLLTFGSRSSHSSKSSSSKLRYDTHGLVWSTGAGLWVGTAEMLRYAPFLLHKQNRHGLFGILGGVIDRLVS